MIGTGKRTKRERRRPSFMGALIARGACRRMPFPRLGAASFDRLSHDGMASDQGLDTRGFSPRLLQ